MLSTTIAYSSRKRYNRKPCHDYGGQNHPYCRTKQDFNIVRNGIDNFVPGNNDEREVDCKDDSASDSGNDCDDEGKNGNSVDTEKERRDEAKEGDASSNEMENENDEKAFFNSGDDDWRDSSKFGDVLWQIVAKHGPKAFPVICEPRWRIENTDWE
ncbi:hypothetical protein C0989_009878 [Termitomyces sp. Mn162]|nr:hypothetical protein C0989_009878 [Termitomyces sp. Mn162]